MIKKPMRKAISIIELVFTIVIIALVFTVIPKVIFALKKSDTLAIRQDAILNTISLMHMISKLPWDEENSFASDILHVNLPNNFPCDPVSHYRVGGFVGSRNCEQNLNASLVFADIGEVYSTFDDVDDFNLRDLNTTLYDINTTVRYCQDFAAGSTTIDLSNCGAPVGSTNLKRVHVRTGYKGAKGAKELMNFSYTSANIGQFFIHKRVW